MSVNMLGAAVAAPLLARAAPRLPAWSLPALAVADALLIAIAGMALPTAVVLGARMLEGAAHVGLATLIMTVASRAHAAGDRRYMPMAGAALMVAVALGSTLGGILVSTDARAPFLAGAAVLVVVAVLMPRLAIVEALRADAIEAATASPLLEALRVAWVPVSAAFVSRFTVGCIVVSFALFAHRAHGLSDTHIGLLFSALTFPFAIVTYPAGRIALRTSPALSLALGGAAYASALLAIAFVPAILLPVIMVLSGVASAFILAPTLCYASSLAGAGQRGRIMALIQAAGCLGMLLGPPAAGVAIATTRTAADPASGYRSAFFLASLSLAMWLVVALPWIVRRARAELASRGNDAAADPS